MKTYTLNNGVTIPQIGYGCYKAAVNGSEEILKAIETGYRLLDTAAFYENEKEVGEAVRLSGVSREELFITSKVWNDHLGYKKTMQSFEQTMEDLQLDYLDLFLLHWPKLDLTNDEWKQLDKESWRALEELYEAGKIRAIGVSNFHPYHLMNLMEDAKIMPAVNQLEIHPGYTQFATVDFCKKHNILLQAWQPIARGVVFDEPVIIELAEKYEKTPAQICLRFVLQYGAIPLPRTVTESRMKENMDIFDFNIEEADMYRILCLPQMGWSGQHPDRERVYF